MRFESPKDAIRLDQQGRRRVRAGGVAISVMQIYHLGVATRHDERRAFALLQNPADSGVPRKWLS